MRQPPRPKPPDMSLFDVCGSRRALTRKSQNKSTEPIMERSVLNPALDSQSLEPLPRTMARPGVEGQVFWVAPGHAANVE
jgi:hypothetical protein